MQLGNLTLDNPVIAAPMAGVSDKPFRLLAREFGAALTFTEMISAKGLLCNNQRTWEMLNLSGEDKAGVQLFGSDPGEMAAAAALAVNHGALIIDINMGCPVTKVLKGGAGAALLRDIPRAVALVQAVAAAVPVPVTVKMRKGWEGEDGVAVALAQAVAEAGASAVTIHGRTRRDFYQGKADWEVIGRVKESVKIPVIGNGDIFQADDALRMRTLTGCDGVMPARGTLGNPWLFETCAAVLQGDSAPSPPHPLGRIGVALRHLEMMVAVFGEERGVLRMRKHLAWYLKGLPGAARLRQEVLGYKEAGEVRERLLDYACRLS